jgi:hypothetical protein
MLQPASLAKNRPCGEIVMLDEGAFAIPKSGAARRHKAGAADSIGQLNRFIKKKR